MVASQYVQHGMQRQGRSARQSSSCRHPDDHEGDAAFIGSSRTNFPAGLVLYWMTGNIFRLLQQVVIFRIDGRPQVPVALEESGPRNDKQQLAEDKRPARPQPGSADRRRRRKRK